MVALSDVVERDRLRSRPASYHEALLHLLPWVIYLGAVAVLLRPILLTAISADDLVNPFSQVYHAGTAIDPILRRTFHFVSVTGHFNYVGQALGNLIVLLWTYLIGNFTIPYSLVYASTKFVFYVLVFLLSARIVRDFSSFLGVQVSQWWSRFTVLLGFVATLQIHIPWSNDPVSSYPMAGFGTVVIGLWFIDIALRVHQRAAWRDALLCGFVGVIAVTYYEFNAYAVMAAAPILFHSLWADRGLPHMWRRRAGLAVVATLPAALVTIGFYLRNRAASAAYSGTDISFGEPFLRTFANGLLGSFPASSWKIATEWLTGPIRTPLMAILLLAVGLILLSAGRTFSSPPLATGPTVGAFRLLVAVSPFFIYWGGATFTQASTVKVQSEATRIGQVYNHYAVGATCLVIVGLIFAIYVKDLISSDRAKQILAKCVTTTAAIMVISQFTINWNVMIQFNGVMSGSRNLLDAFADAPPMTQRCQALDIWKTMGWPEYYWLDMELGLNQAYKIYRGEEFCTR